MINVTLVTMPTQTLKIVRIDSLLHQRAKILAAELDIPLGVLVEDAVRARLDLSAVLKRPKARERAALKAEIRQNLEARL